jgi:hypothetical protein
MGFPVIKLDSSSPVFTFLRLLHSCLCIFMINLVIYHMVIAGSNIDFGFGLDIGVDYEFRAVSVNTFKSEANSTRHSPFMTCLPQ